MRKLFGNYEVTIDDKNRVLIPAEVRRAMDPVVDGEAFYLVTGQNGKPWLWPEKQYESHADVRGSDINPDMDDLQFDHLAFGMAVRLPLDKQGRMLIPERSMQEMSELQLGREVTLVAARDHLELWPREQWLEYRRDLERRRLEINARARQKYVTPAISTGTTQKAG